MLPVLHAGRRLSPPPRCRRCCSRRVSLGSAGVSCHRWLPFCAAPSSFCEQCPGGTFRKKGSGYLQQAWNVKECWCIARLVFTPFQSCYKMTKRTLCFSRRPTTELRGKHRPFKCCVHGHLPFRQCGLVPVV